MEEKEHSEYVGRSLGMAVSNSRTAGTWMEASWELRNGLLEMEMATRFSLNILQVKESF